MPRYKLTIEYDGADFSGWQRQENGASVQQALEEALFALTGETPRRSRRGPHRRRRSRDGTGRACRSSARVERLAPARGDQRASRRRSPIAVLEAEPAAEDFDARRSAVMRHYLYRIVNRRAPLTFERGRAWHVKRELDAAAMQEAARALIGRHDFSTFRDSQCQAKSPVRTLTRLDVDARGRPRRIFRRARCRSCIGRCARWSARWSRSGSANGGADDLQGGAGGGRPQPLRAGGAGLRALSRARRLRRAAGEEK